MKGPHCPHCHKGRLEGTGRGAVQAEFGGRNLGTVGAKSSALARVPPGSIQPRVPFPFLLSLR